MISLRSKRGDWNKTESFLKRASSGSVESILSRYGQEGVNALSSATPMRSGRTASSWSFEIEQTSTGYKIVWNNSNINDGVNIAVIIQYGHGTGTGGYVEGIDYINPALQPVFEELADAAWKEVTR